MSVNDLLIKANILTVKERYDYYVLVFVFYALKFKSPVTSIQSFFEFSQHSRRQLLTKKRHNSKIFEKCVSLQGEKLWNALPISLRDINFTPVMFKFKLIQLLTSSRDNIYA